MNELVWEGLLEILREGQPSLKAAAHLWRRDDISGSDWGGQLELPVVFRRLLPAEEYQVRLPSGTEARVRVAGGPSTTTMTFPTLTGIGQPPFGAPVASALVDIDEVELGEPAPVPAPRRSAEPARPRERGGRGEAPPRVHRNVVAPATPAAPAALPTTAVPTETPQEPVTPAPVPEPVVAAVAPSAPAAAAPRPAEALETAAADQPRGTGRRTPARTRTERPAVALVSRAQSQKGVDVEESVEQTEALARAFLASIEGRQALRALDLPGFGGRAIAAAQHDVELVASTLEGALRAPNGSTDWVDALRPRLTMLAWFASLAAPDEQAEVALAGSAVGSLLQNLEGFLALGTEGVEGLAA